MPTDDHNMGTICGVFKAFGDPVRLRLLSLLHDRGEMCVCELLDELGTSQSNISTHLRVLRSAGLVQRSKVGKWVFYALDPPAVEQLQQWLEGTLGTATMAVDRPTEQTLYQACCAGDIPGSLAEAQDLFPRTTGQSLGS